MEKHMNHYKVVSKKKVSLAAWDPDDCGEFVNQKDEARNKLEQLTKQLEALQELLYAEHKHKILVVLQGMDTSGKDGTIRHVFEGVNPQGVRVAGFKVPTPIELDHDYLWRVHKQVPAKGELVIFNRSHYEDVLVVRIHNLVPPEIWSARYDQINEFERLLSEEGTTIIKFYLHIDKDEQKQRLQDRIDEPDKRWKFNPGDLKERLLWNDYIRAYEDVLSKTSTDWAPWYVVPANRKWYRNFVVASVIVDTLTGLNMQIPQNDYDFSNVSIE